MEYYTSTRCEFYFDDVTVTLTLPFKVSRKEQHSFSRLLWAKKTWHKCHSLLDVTSV